ncbi:MAG: septation protein SpoVG family protein [Nitrospinae bacterium]|nr:septation protein SpoVG family protein [Nitrospinota bacterium]
MNITSIKIYPFDAGIPQSSLRAYADVVLDDLLVIKGFKVLVAKSGGLFIGMPSQKGKDGKYYDQIEFKADDFQSELRARILESYKEFS